MRYTPGITAAAAAPGAAFTVMPRVDPTSYRARATVLLTSGLPAGRTHKAQWTKSGRHRAPRSAQAERDFNAYHNTP